MLVKLTNGIEKTEHLAALAIPIITIKSFEELGGTSFCFAQRCLLPLDANTAQGQSHQ